MPRRSQGFRETRPPVCHREQAFWQLRTPIRRDRVTRNRAILARRRLNGRRSRCARAQGIASTRQTNALTDKPTPLTNSPETRRRTIVAETATPEGIQVVLFEDTWQRHVLDPQSGHVELEPHLGAALEAITSPDHREADAWSHRERFFKRDVGPSRWLMVVADSERDPARIVTALGYGHGRSPAGWMP